MRALFGLEHALALGLGDDGLDLFVGDALVALAALAEQAQHAAARDVEQQDQRRADRGDHAPSAGATRAAMPLGVAQRDLLGHQLADDQRDVGDDDDHDADAERPRRGRRSRPAPIRISPSRSPSVAPEKAPESTPTSVMPICTEDRNLPGSSGQLQRHRGALVAVGGHAP